MPYPIFLNQIRALSVWLGEWVGGWILNIYTFARIVKHKTQISHQKPKCVLYTCMCVKRNDKTKSPLCV